MFRLVFSLLFATTWFSGAAWGAPPSSTTTPVRKPDDGTGREILQSTSTRLDRAAILTSEGKNEDSSQILRAILGTSDPGLQERIRELLMLNERSLYHYRDAFEAIAPLLKRGADRDLINKARLLEALIDVPPETMDSGNQLNLRDFHLAAVVGRSSFGALVDTGATWCVISRSAVRQAGLLVRPVGYRIATSLGREVYADVAVGDVRLGLIRIRNVVFLVPSRSTFGEASSPSILIGLPILRQLAVSIGRTRGESTGADIGFVAGVPVVATSFRGVRLPCELDTGADRTSFAAAHLQVRGLDRARGERKRISVTSAAGNIAGVPVYEIAVRIGVADREVTLPDALVIGGAEKAMTQECSLGRDAVLRLAPLTLNFRSMRILVQ